MSFPVQCLVGGSTKDAEGVTTTQTLPGFLSRSTGTSKGIRGETEMETKKQSKSETDDSNGAALKRENQKEPTKVYLEVFCGP